MQSVNEFKEKLVKIEPIEGTDHIGYGHFPFQMISVSPSGSISISALALGGDIRSCMERFSENLKGGASKVYISLDFSPAGDIDKDFVAIYSFDESRLKVVDMIGIPYCSKSGKMYDEIHWESSKHLTAVYRQLIQLTQSS